MSRPVVRPAGRASGWAGSAQEPGEDHATTKPRPSSRWLLAFFGALALSAALAGPAAGQPGGFVYALQDVFGAYDPAFRGGVNVGAR